MAKTVDPNNLGIVLRDELSLYHQRVVAAVNAAGEDAAKALVRKTKATAPKRRGDFRKAITYKVSRSFTGDKTFVWGAKSPHHRLTHLLVNGHAKKGGGRVPGDPFLKNALDEVLPEYERKVEEAITE